MPIIGQKMPAAGKTLGEFGSKLYGLLLEYLDKWRRLGQMKDREKELWIGIHGGAVLLLVILIAVSAGGRGGSATRKEKLNAEKLWEEVAEDGKLTEEEATYAAGLIHTHADWEKWVDIYFNSEKELDIDFSDAVSFVGRVQRYCCSMSVMGTLIEEYGQWYDKDGLAEKIFGSSDQVDYVDFSGLSMYPQLKAPREVNGNTIYQMQYNDNEQDVSVSWYAYPESDEVTFIKEVLAGEEWIEEEYVGRLEGFGTEFVITMDGEEYHFAEASTEVARREQELFETMAKGTWEYSQEFYNVITSSLGSWDKYPNSFHETPLYMSFYAEVTVGNGSMLVRGLDGILLENMQCTYEQGEGKTVTIVAKNTSARLEASYDKVDGNLVMTVNGSEYVLTPTFIEKTGTYNEWGSRN